MEIRTSPSAMDFILRNIDIALGIHGGTNGIKELAREEKPIAAADR